MTKSNFGLIHYDFEFDDAIYHWYAMDIEQALNSLQDCIPAKDFIHKRKCFMNGYLSEYEISSEFEDILPACRRFANLYGYARIHRSIAEQWQREPD